MWEVGHNEDNHMVDDCTFTNVLLIWFLRALFT